MANSVQHKSHLSLRQNMTVVEQMDCKWAVWSWKWAMGLTLSLH